ncbi:phage tail protein [Parasalinivibrio latis]|uniref:phage tail protein n=1 Tax=Parasalinivibrio latis TaxID=2952610 RepID=UPI0030E42875
MMMMLGGYRFSVDTVAYERISRDTGYRWEKQDVIGTQPALQFLGPGDDTLSLDGVLYPHYRGGLGQLNAMRAQAGLGVPLMLIEGNGKVLGRWVIERVQETQRTFDRDGTPAKIRFSLRLRKQDAGRNQEVNDLTITSLAQAKGVS